MADGSDDPRQIDPLARLVERGVVVAAASRYSPGGQQVGGPAAQGPAVARGRSLARRVGPGRHRRRHQQLQGLLDRVRPRGGHRQPQRLRDRARADRQGAPAAPPGRGAPHDLAGPDARASRASTCKGWVPKYLRWYRFAFGPRAHGRARSDARRRGSPPATNSVAKKLAESSRIMTDNERSEVLVTGSAGLHRRLRRRGAPRAAATRWRASTTTPSTARSTKSYDDHPRLPLRRGRRPRRRPDDRAARRLRPLHRRGRPDRRHLLLPHLRLRPAGDQRADHRRDVRRRDRGAPAEGRLKKVTYLSAPRWCSSPPTTGPRKEGDERTIPPPLSSYGFQKLAVEYFAKAAWDQYQLPYTIVRPFNCVGIGEGRALGDVEVPRGNVKLAMSHVVPGPGPEGRSRARTRCTSSATAARSGTTPTAATWPAGIVDGDGAGPAPPTRTSTSPPPSRRPCWSWPR